jgi:hypothetical protein
MTTSTGPSRRRLLAKAGLLFNGIVGAILAVPIVRYLLSPVTRESKPGYESWLTLGKLEEFPESQTRLATYRNPVVNSGTAKPGTFRAGSEIWANRISRSSQSIAPIWDVRCAGSRSRTCSCARVTAAFIMRMAHTPRALRRAGCFSTDTEWWMESS